MAARGKGKAPSTTSVLSSGPGLYQQQHHHGTREASRAASREASHLQSGFQGTVPKLSKHASCEALSDASHEPAHVRHYPLDLLSGLPFERYEHRRISTRDILVHRILSKLMLPSTRGLAESLDQTRDQTRRKTCNYFGLIKQHDPILAREIQVLQKTLITSLSSEWCSDIECQPEMGGDHYMSPETSFLSVQDQILDLIRLYFWETDDAATRLWLQSMQPTRRAVYDTLSKLPAKKGSRNLSSQERRRQVDSHAKLRHKSWYQDDKICLQGVTQQLALAPNIPRLYDGGAFTSRLRLMLLKGRPGRMVYLRMIAEMEPVGDARFWDKQTLFPCPEPRQAPRRYLHIPLSNLNSLSRHWKDPPKVEFSAARVGRGLDRDGIWSTNQWPGDMLDRGRTRRRQRRRTTSEPPPGLFMASRLPADRCALAQDLVIFPKMSLITLERRVRSRSLSRTRIAEMFNWDTVIDETLDKSPKTSPETLRLKNSEDSGIRAENTNKTVPMSGELKLFVDYLAANSDLTAQVLFATLLEHASASRRLMWHLRNPCDIDEDSSTDDETRIRDFLSFLEMERPPLTPHALNEAQGENQMKDSSKQDETRSCENCKMTSHETIMCALPCGYCGATSPILVFDTPGNLFPGNGNPHKAPNCPVARQNRCKCVPFPQFHVAAKCAILCSRDCGNPYHPGHFKHKSAMTCQSRCCMCGMRGHSGAKCKLRHCHCGESHLGQDCRFHPECRVQGCNRFLCGVHCQSCGLDRAKLEDGVVLRDQKCPSCHDADGFAKDRAKMPSQKEEAQRGSQGEPGDIDPETVRKKKRRRNRRKYRPVEPQTAPVKERKPWYAPFEPRTRPVVLSKSGKKANAKYKRNASDQVPGSEG